MSRENLGELRHRLGAAVQAQQAAVDDFDSAMARHLGVNRTDLRCLEILLGTETATPQRLGAELGLTSGSVTTMIDRLEKLGYVTRSRDTVDRRKVAVRAEPVVRDRAGALLGPLIADGHRLVSDYTADQLRLIIDFLEANRELQRTHVERVRKLPPAG